MFEELKEYMDEIHKTGAKLFVQLTAGMGRSWAITELVAPLHKNKFTRALIKPIIDTNHELAQKFGYNDFQNLVSKALNSIAELMVLAQSRWKIDFFA